MHPEMIERMMRWLDQQASADDKRVLQAHLMECVSCANEWASLFAIHQQMTNISMRAPAPGFANRVMQRLAQREQQHVARQMLIGIPMLIFGSVAAFALAFYLSPFGALVSDGWTTIVTNTVALTSFFDALSRVADALGYVILERLDQTTLVLLTFTTLGLTLAWARLVTGAPLANRRIS